MASLDTIDVIVHTNTVWHVEPWTSIQLASALYRQVASDAVGWVIKLEPAPNPGVDQGAKNANDVDLTVTSKRSAQHCGAYTPTAPSKTMIVTEQRLSSNCRVDLALVILDEIWNRIRQSFRIQKTSLRELASLKRQQGRQQRNLIQLQGGVTIARRQAIIGVTTVQNSV